jgi:hypothetical protein
MAYQMKVDGMAEISELLDKMEKQAPKVASRALYEGAGVMAKEIREQIEAIKTEPFKYAKEGQRLPSPEEKEVLLNAGAGIAKFDKNSTEVDTSVGFNSAGYADVKFKHMSRQARTNYKKVKFGNKESVSSNAMYVLVKHGLADNGAQNQKPIGVIANSINSGTSFMKKQPFFRKAVNKGSKKAMQAMSKSIEGAFGEYIREMNNL